MEIEFPCPHCAEPLTIDDSYRGSETQCPSCNQSFVIPSSEIAVEPEPPPVSTPTAPSDPRDRARWAIPPNQNPYYKHSGAITALSPLTILLIGGLGTVVLSCIYAYAVFYIPFIYLNFLLTAGLGAGVGYVVWYGAKVGKLRNTGLFLVLSLMVGGLLALYISWVAWIFALSKQSALVLSPVDIITVMQRLAKEGVWSLRSLTPTGLALYSIWGLEAVAIVGVATLVSLRLFRSTPFCERCNRWVETPLTISPLHPIANPDGMKEELERGDFSSLASLCKVRVGDSAYTDLELLQCSGCRNLSLLTLKSVTIESDSKGRDDKKENEIVENLLIDAATFDRLKDCGKNVVPAGSA